MSTTDNSLYLYYDSSSTFGPDGQLQLWDDRNIADDAGVQHETFEDQRFGHVGPWNHLQSFNSHAINPNHQYRLSSDLSSDVPSSVGTAGWPGTSPPDSSSAFALYDSTIDAGRLQNVEPFTPTKQGAANHLTYNEDRKILDAISNNPTVQALPNQEIPGFYSPEGNRRISSDISNETLDFHIESPSLYQRHEAVPSPDHGNPLRYPTEVLSTGHNVTSFNYSVESISYHNNEPGLYNYDDPLSEYAGLTHPQSALIGNEGKSERFPPDAALSPPTLGCIPDYWPGGPTEESRLKSKPASRSVALRPAPRNSRGNRKPSITIIDPPLSVIHEDGKGGLASSSPTSKKGRRAGPLSKSKAAQAAKMRKEKSVCIRCKTMKQSVGH